ncbi:MAG: hypothetical protein ACJ74W_03690 [Pyrinomonadaceae bacterium]
MVSRRLHSARNPIERNAQARLIEALLDAGFHIHIFKPSAPTKFGATRAHLIKDKAAGGGLEGRRTDY